MTNAKSTKRALFTSAFAILICVAMLIGTTFAWFTDTASTGVNKIQAGNLDVALEMKENDEWVNAEGKTLDFKKAKEGNNEEILWEPGCTYELPELRVVNNGNLALKYKIMITGINGNAKLNEAIIWTVGDAALGTEQHLIAGESNEFKISGHMKEEAGNEYQGLSIDGISITVYAAQDTVEYDSFNNTYDANATYYPVIDAAGLKGALANGGNIDVDADVATNNSTDSAAARMVVSKPTTLNLNKKIISPDNMGNNKDNFAALYVDADTTINAGKDGGIDTGKNGGYGINVRNGATLTINGGYYYGGGTAVQVQKGTLVINGGTFACEPYSDSKYGYKYLINCIDAAYKDGTAKVAIYGGTFINFDPSDSASENPHGNFVADGYSVISEKQANGDVWYTVVKGTGAVVGTQEELSTAISNNSDVTVKLTKAGTYSLTGMTDKEVSIIGTKDTVIDMKNKTNKAKSISFEGVTVNFGTGDYYGFQHTGKLTYKDCTITGKQFLYGNEVEFNNCVFEQDTLDYNVWTYGAGTVLFNSCTFNCKGKAVLIYNEGSIAGQTVEFKNCKFNASIAFGKAAIEIDSSLLKNGATYKVIIDKATANNVNGFSKGSVSGNSVWNNKKGDNATVIVDGETVLSAK